MAVSLLDWRALLVAVLLAPAVSHGASPRAQARGPGADRVLTIDAASSDVDINSNHLVLRDVTISQGGMSVKAREAEADGPELSFENSRWQFRGEVRIRTENTNLDADASTVSFTGNRIARAVVTGAPAQFEQKLDKRSAQGKAKNIDYDLTAGRVTLTQGYWFTDGRNEWSSESLGLVYSVREQRVQSGGATTAPEGGGRVHITIRPDDDTAKPAEPPAP